STLIYLALAILLRQLLAGLGWMLFPRKASR
ncbi:amino acid ABC transporter permease, partial [Mesorhizobium sp. M5C.F.Ca.IN.020.32.2.1]